VTFAPKATHTPIICRYSEAWDGRKRDDTGVTGVSEHRANSLPASPEVKGQSASGQSDCSTVPSPDASSPETQAKKRSDLPRIYYATRTHSQIGQVCRAQHDQVLLFRGEIHFFRLQSL